MCSGSVNAKLGETGLLCVFWLLEPPHVIIQLCGLFCSVPQLERDGGVCMKLETVHCQAIKAILDTPLSRVIRTCGRLAEGTPTVGTSSSQKAPRNVIFLLKINL